MYYPDSPDAREERAARYRGRQFAAYNSIRSRLGLPEIDMYGIANPYYRDQRLSLTPEIDEKLQGGSILSSSEYNANLLEACLAIDDGLLGQGGKFRRAIREALEAGGLAE